jgi:hypothetical protein
MQVLEVVEQQLQETLLIMMEVVEQEHQMIF